MALINFICPKCGYETEELVKSDGVYPRCPKCGEILEQKFDGKNYANTTHKTACSGNCKTCKGCH